MLQRFEFAAKDRLLRWFPMPLAALSVGLLCPVARAASIVSDGGFESAGASAFTYAGQTIDGGSWLVASGAVYIDSVDPYVYAGQNSLNLTLANLYVPNTLTQSLATAPGQTYDLSFYANANSPNSFSVAANGSALTGLPGSVAQNGFANANNSSLFEKYTGVFTASSANTVLSFTSTADPAIGSPDGSVMIDDVAVQPVAATPEPGSLGLVLTGVVGLGGAIRRRVRVRSAA